MKRVNKYKSFIDRLRLHARAGTGGMGYPNSGGIGGKGGDIYVVAEEEDFTLMKLKKMQVEQRYRATDGRNSLRTALLGLAGKDLHIPAPIGTVVSTDHKILGELNNVGDMVLVAKGGSGGSLLNQFSGQHGQMMNINLNLKLIADIGLVGFPNAGKSTFLRAASSARPKIASYPFTTLQPHIGVVVFPNLRQMTVADLPGLVEGAWANVGMGHNFLRHVERTKILLFIVDVNGFQLGPMYPHRSAIENVLLLNRELELYRYDLTERPSLLVVNKMDVPGAEEKLKKLVKGLENIEEIVNEFPEHVRPEQLVKFDDVIPCSTRSNPPSVEYIKDYLCDMLDKYSITDEQRDEIEQKARNEVAHLLNESSNVKFL